MGEGEATWPATSVSLISGERDQISGGTSAAHYVSDYDEVAGIRLPAKHRIFPRIPDGQSLAEPLVVSIDLSEIAFT